MGIAHTWKIRKLVQKNDGTGTIIQVYFKIHSTDGEYYYASSGNVELDTNNIESFVSYQDLTEEQVILWVKDKLGESASDYEQANIDWINDKKNSPAPTTKVERLPWEPEPIVEESEPIVEESEPIVEEPDPILE
jgi:formylmethanofuran dehydrogenase subunit E-like metal-binding protein